MVSRCDLAPYLLPEDTGDAYREEEPPLKLDNYLEPEPPDIHYQAEPGNENLNAQIAPQKAF